VRCPWCSSADDKVVDSREVEQGGAVRRRRQCTACGQRFTTYERVAEALHVLKRSGERVPFVRSKVTAGVRAACKNRPVGEEQIASLAEEVEEAMRQLGPSVTSEQIGLSVLERLRVLDHVASVRFASVYKGFEDIGDFARELGLITSREEGPPSLEKQTAPKQTTARERSS
jgi:transcriptional repressor NrdR